MAKINVKKFIELVRKSGLIESDAFGDVLAEAKRRRAEGQATDPETLAEQLVEAELLTRWQVDKLLVGKHKGFFLGKYRLLGHLGTGGMSSVYLAQHILMQRQVAIKVLPKTRVEDSSYLARFHLEAQAAAALDHPNIVRAYDIDNDGDIHYLVMEYVEGRDLQAIVKQDGPVEYATAAEYIRQSAEALGHAHDANIIHRDIKPANLLLDTKGTVKLLDLGLARFCDGKKGSLTLDHDENVLGTADYLSPEQAINSHEVDTRADIYSLGCTFYYLLTGHPPFNEGTLSQRLLMHQKEAPPSIFIDRPDAPNDLVNICVRMMVKKAKGRYQTCREVSKVLSDWLTAQGQQVPTGSSSVKLATAGAVGQAAAGQSPAKPTPRRTPGKTPRRAPTPEPAPPVPGDTLASSADETAKAKGGRPAKPPVARPREESKPRRGPPKLPREPSQQSEAKLRTATPLDSLEVAPNDEFPEFSIDVNGLASPARAKAAPRSKSSAKQPDDKPPEVGKQDSRQAVHEESSVVRPISKKPLFWVAVGGFIVVLGGLVGVTVYLLTR